MHFYFPHSYPEKETILYSAIPIRWPSKIHIPAYFNKIIMGEVKEVFNWVAHF